MRVFAFILSICFFITDCTAQQETKTKQGLTKGDKSEFSEFRPILGPAPPKFFHGPKFPKQNCTVLDEILAADICTPAFETECMIETITTKKIIEVDYCFTLNRTVCTVTQETFENEVCTYEYIKKEEASTAKTVLVQFEKKCRKQKVTVCDYAGYQQYDPYDPHTFGYQPICKEVAQETCFNVPAVEPIDVPVTIAFPEPVKKCQNSPITLPKVVCEIESEEKCMKVPSLEEKPTTIEKCQPIIGTPKCQRVELVLPKQVCQDIIYGFTHRPIDFQE